MKLIIEKTYEDLSKRAANMIKEEIEKKPNLVLGLATGSTPKGTYEYLIQAHKNENLDFSKVTTFNLDEYIGLSEDHPGSYRYYMNKILFDHINVDKNNIHVPNGKASNLEEYCKTYDKEIEASGGIDLQILGIGTNGHIAFNEPGVDLPVGTSIVELTENTIKDNSRFFKSIEDTPKTAISLGMGGILKAKKILLLANGENKKEIMNNLLNRDSIDTRMPASLLLLHPDVTVIVDREAYSGHGDHSIID